MGRIDYQWNANHSLFGRYMATSVKNPTPLEKSDQVLSLCNTTRAAGIPGLDKLAQSVAVGDTLIFGPNTVNSLRFAFNRTSIDRLDTPLFDPYALGSDVYSYSPGSMVLAVTGGFNIANPGGGLFETNSSQLSDDLTLVRGRHQLSIGANLAYWKHYFFSHARSGGDWMFSGQLTGLGLADFLIGRVSRLEHGGPAIMPMNQWYLGLYAQDTWRMTSRITVNAGLRWEPYFGASVLNGAVYNFSHENFQKGIETTVFNNAPAGLIYPGDPGFPPGQTGLNTQWWNLSPRVGVAWDVTGSGRMAIRARPTESRMTSRPRSINSSTRIRPRSATVRWWKILQACSTNRTGTLAAIRIRLRRTPIRSSFLSARSAPPTLTSIRPAFSSGT